MTAGLDLSIGEFEEVGTIVKEYASEDATVVVGTVIDPEMSNQIRVTVVATGLGGSAAAQRSRAEPTRDRLAGALGEPRRDAKRQPRGRMALRASARSRAEQWHSARQKPAGR